MVKSRMASPISVVRSVSATTIIVCLIQLIGFGVVSAQQLPQKGGPQEPAASTQRKVGWTLRDLVMVREISDVAISSDGRKVAYIVKQPRIDRNDVRYELYVASTSTPSLPRKLVEASFIADISWHPGTALITARLDLGKGAQVYDIDSTGQARVLVETRDSIWVGGLESMVIDGYAPRLTGIVSYEWNEDGSRLWYSKFIVGATSDKAYLYDEGTMNRSWFWNDRSALRGIELHVRNFQSGADRTLVVLHPTPFDAGSVFRRDYGTAGWSADSKYIQYLDLTPGRGGARPFVLRRVDAMSGRITDVDVDKAEPMELFDSVPTPDGQDYLTVRGFNAGRQLVEVDSSGGVRRNYGYAGFTRVSKALGAWWSNDRKSMIIGVHFRDRDSLVMYAGSGIRTTLGGEGDLEHCSFAKDLRLGVCVRQSITQAPEVVSVEPGDGEIRTLVRPNADYDRISPLRVTRATWKNKYGHANDGYITYPRDYMPGRRYPVICVTHGSDARNTFADEEFQWQYPVQVFAERGYLVLSVNEPTPTARSNAAMDAIMTAGRITPNMKVAYGLDPVASMEAAVAANVMAGIADPQRVGIAGYSRGSQVVNLAMTQSKIFKVGSSGEGNFLNASLYWLSGSAMIRRIYTGLFGGSPYDRNAIENYQEFSPSFRARQFAGPLLQQDTSGTGITGLELYGILRGAGVPTELAIYPHEAHTVFQPKHRLAAMALNIKWFDYWLLSKRDGDARYKDLYARWDAMRRTWRSSRRSH